MYNITGVLCLLHYNKFILRKYSELYFIVDSQWKELIQTLAVEVYVKHWDHKTMICVGTRVLVEAHVLGRVQNKKNILKNLKKCSPGFLFLKSIFLIIRIPKIFEKILKFSKCDVRELVTYYYWWYRYWNM